MTARLFLKLQLWFNWHFTWDEFTSTVGLAIHSCFYSVGDRTVVILPSFTTALFKGNPFLFPTYQPPSPIISSPHSEGTKLTSSQTRLGNIVYSESREQENPIRGNDWEYCALKGNFFCLKVNKHTLITVIECDESLGWRELQWKSYCFISMGYWDFGSWSIDKLCKWYSRERLDWSGEKPSVCSNKEQCFHYEPVEVAP